VKDLLKENKLYYVLKNLVLWARSEISGSDLEFWVQNLKFQAPNHKQAPNYKHPAKKTADKQISNTMPKAGKNHKFQVSNSKQGLKLFGI
jgi:hypothetical protein